MKGGVAGLEAVRLSIVFPILVKSRLLLLFEYNPRRPQEPPSVRATRSTLTDERIFSPRDAKPQRKFAPFSCTLASMCFGGEEEQGFGYSLVANAGLF